jgi:hypothetical protein
MPLVESAAQTGKVGQARMTARPVSIPKSPFQKAPVVGRWVRAKEAAPLLLQIADIGARQGGEPGWHVLLRDGGDNDCGLDWLGWCGSFHAVPFLLGFA